MYNVALARSVSKICDVTEVVVLQKEAFASLKRIVYELAPGTASQLNSAAVEETEEASRFIGIPHKIPPGGTQPIDDNNELLLPVRTEFIRADCPVVNRFMQASLV